MAVLKGKQARRTPWLVRLLVSRPRKLVAVVRANKMARIAWALMMRQEDFRAMPAAD
jgi:transposase